MGSYLRIFGQRLKILKYNKLKMCNRPYSGRKWYDADLISIKRNKPLKHSTEYKIKAIKFLNELCGKELSEEEIPESLRLTAEEKKKLK